MGNSCGKFRKVLSNVSRCHSFNAQNPSEDDPCQPSTQSTTHADLQQYPLIPGLPDDVALQCIARVPRASHSMLRSVCKSWKHLVDSHEIYTVRSASNLTEEWFYVLTLFPLLKAFDPRATRWHTLPPMPGVLYKDLLIDCACVVVGHKLLVIGGLHIETSDLKMIVRREVLIYCSLTNTWQSAAPMLTPRRNFAYGVIGSTVYVAGGHNLDEGYLHTAEAYSLTNDAWKPLPPLAPKKGPCIGAVMNKRFCVVENCEGGSYCVELLNEAGDNWEMVDAMSSSIQTIFPKDCQRPLRGPTVLDGKLYAIARDGTSIRVYDCASRLWSVIQMPPLPPELMYTIHGIAGFKGELYVIGLRSAKERALQVPPPLRTLYAYNPKAPEGSDPWRKVVPLDQYTRRFHIGYVGFAIISV